MVGYTEALKFIKRDAERALSSTVRPEHQVGMMTANLRQILYHADNALDLYNWCWVGSTESVDIAREVADEVADALNCQVLVEYIGDNGDKDVGYELVTMERGNFCIAIVLEGVIWRVYNECPERHPVPLKNVKELVIGY
jgi:hypothetical protein